LLKQEWRMSVFARSHSFRITRENRRDEQWRTDRRNGRLAPSLLPAWRCNPASFRTENAALDGVVGTYASYRARDETECKKGSSRKWKTECKHKRLSGELYIASRAPSRGGGCKVVAVAVSARTAQVMPWSLGVVISMRMRLDKQKEIKLKE
jgi:hypothetical protein